MTKKLRLTAIVLCFCLVFSMCVLTACDKTVYFEVTAQFDASKGEVTIVSDSNDGSGGSAKFVKGESVTVTVTPKDNFEIKKFTVNGKDENLSDGTFVFTVAENVSIEVVFLPARTGVYLDFDETKGSVTLSPAPANGEFYVDGEQVNVKVEPKENYLVKSATLNGAAQGLTNGGFSLTVTGPMEITVTFAGKPLPAQHYASLEGRIKLTGEYFYDATNDEEDFRHTLIAIYGQDDFIYNFECDAETGEVYYDNIYLRNPDDISKIAMQIIGLDNTVSVIPSSDFYNNYANPFKSTVIASDFEYAGTRDGKEVYKASNPASADIRAAASAITGWNETIKEFTVLFEDGKADGIKIVTEEIDIQNVDFTYHSTYEFTVTEHGTANVPTLKPFERVAEHDILVAALRQAQEAARYTVRHRSHELNYNPDDGDDHKDLDYNKYVTEDTVFFNHLNWEYGYTVINGHVYPFKYFPEQRDENGNVTVQAHVTTDDAVNVSGIEAVQATFALACAPELFKYVGDNRFVLRDGPTYAPYVLPAFGEGTDEPRYFQYGTSLTVTVGEDGRLAELEFSYATYGITEEVTLTYDFDTEIDLSYLDFENADHHSVLDPFIGEYADDMGNTAIVDIYGFVINGTAAEIIGYNADNAEFTAKWENQTIYIGKLSQRQLLIVNESNTIFWTLNSVNNTAVTIPDTFKGHWYRYDVDYDEHFDFVIQSHAVRYNGTLLELLSYTMSEGVVATDGTYTYNLSLVRDEDGILLLEVLIIDKEGMATHLYAEYVDAEIGIEIPEKFVGTYYSYSVSDGENRVDITYASITINGKPFIPTSYTEKDGFIGTYGDITDYSVMFGFSNDQLVIGTEALNYSLKRVQTIESKYVGIWKPRFNDVNAQIVITDMSIEIRYNGNVDYFGSGDFRLTEYGYTVTTSWNAFNVNLLYFIDRQTGLPTLSMYDNNEENPLLISFNKASGDSEDPEDVKIPAEWEGAYSGVFEVMDKKGETVEKTLNIRLKFENGKAYLDIGNGELKETVLVDFDDEWVPMLIVELDGIEYYIMLMNYGEHDGQFYVAEENHDNIEKRLLLDVYLTPEA